MTASRPMPKFTGPEMLKIFRGDVLIGTVTNLETDWPWIGGKIQLTPEADCYKPMSEFWTTEGRYADNAPFEEPADIEENWFVEDEEGNRIHIELLAVHSDGEAWWCEYSPTVEFEE